MRIFVWLARLLVFILLLGFAIRNDAPVTLNFFFSTQWKLPLVLVLLLMFVAGAAVGVLALLPTLLSKHREVSRLRRLRGEPALPRNVRPQYPDSP
ncbi:MAG: lipopolysaccharide assembly protein LapA domain-containing protein [Rhodocyclaceae bacterium]